MSFIKYSGVLYKLFTFPRLVGGKCAQVGDVPENTTQMFRNFVKRAQSGFKNKCSFSAHYCSVMECLYCETVVLFCWLDSTATVVCPVKTATYTYPLAMTKHWTGL